MTEFASYFDDSGHPDDKPFVIIAGFIATEDQWLRFEKEWLDHLAPMGIEIFHMADFEKSTKWTRNQKDDLLRKLIGTIRVRTRIQMQAIVPMAPYQEINEKYAFEEAFGAPYAVAGRTIAKFINEWKEQYAKPEDKMLVFFEDGSKHKGDFMAAMERDGLPCPGFLKKSEAVPLQAADLIAWEGHHAMRYRQPRWTLQYLIDKHPLRDGTFPLEELEKMCRGITPWVPLRANLAPNAEITYQANPKRLRHRTIYPRPPKD